jgi:hypothetical protein
MPMTVCPECGKPVSTEAYTCPSCGYPRRPPPMPTAKKQGMPWYVGCLIAFAGFFVVIPVIGLLAAIAIPSFVKARTASQSNACFNNLRQIEIAKETWDTAPPDATGVDTGAVMRLLAKQPHCPVGGTYDLGGMGRPATCSKHGSIGGAPAPPETTIDVEAADGPTVH